ncbi:ornithine decarboxylase 2-like isoform X3 [Plodia interpunctella]|nr:ornithine decarboxylase 2-like isoform X2 [Plodia interpunctella]XP_053599665.1 ornithine decarboxylase 2-like isoform X3 [Plodia interpunctella]
MFLLRIRVHYKQIFTHKPQHTPAGVYYRGHHRLPLLQRVNPTIVEDFEKRYQRRENEEIYYQKSESISKTQKHRSPAFVLDGCTPNDVATAMIESGRQKEPFYLFHLDEAYRRIQHFKRRMPRVQIFYAMKANDDDMFLKLCLSFGLGFDCASPGEINKVRHLNNSPRRIIYATPSKTREQITFARDSGVRHTTFDSSYELMKIKQFWPDARLLLRIRVDGESMYKLGKKFGCDFETEAIGLLEEAASLGLSVVGVAFHVGSACSCTDSYVLGLRRSKALFEYEDKAGRGMHIVDIGGGFMSDTTDRIDEVADFVNEALDEYFPDPTVQVVAEPGRYLCDSSYTMYCSINNVRKVVKNGKRTNMLYLNDGIYGTLRFPEPWHTVQRFKKSSDRVTDVLEDTILWGPSCDSTDRVMPNIPLQLPRCTPDDWLVFSLQGAYTFGFSTRFSCLGVPLIRPVVSSHL